MKVKKKEKTFFPFYLFVSKKFYFSNFHFASVVILFIFFLFFFLFFLFWFLFIFNTLTNHWRIRGFLLTSYCYSPSSHIYTWLSSTSTFKLKFSLSLSLSLSLTFKHLNYQVCNSQFSNSHNDCPCGKTVITYYK